MMGERRLQEASQNVAEESDPWSVQPVGGQGEGRGLGESAVGGTPAQCHHTTQRGQSLSMT